MQLNSPRELLTYDWNAKGVALTSNTCRTFHPCCSKSCRSLATSSSIESGNASSRPAIVREARFKYSMKAARLLLSMAVPLISIQSKSPHQLETVVYEEPRAETLTVQAGKKTGGGV